MYRYTDFDQALVDARVDQYRDQTRRYLDGALAEGEFLPLRLRNGLYVQRLAPMLRVAIPYGTLSSRQMRMLAHIARHYDKGYGHFSTRQNVQFNWPQLEEVPDILADLARVQMHSIQTSGNCIRNVTTDQFAGVAADEIVDARPYCEIIRQWSTDHPEFDWLPRKFKIAVNGARNDRAAIAIHDIGLQLTRNADGEVRIAYHVGGGLGRTPVIGPLIRDDVAVEDMLTYIEAIMRVYNRYGRRDNKHKARIKILVRAMGPEAFAEAVNAEWAKVRDSAHKLPAQEVARVAAHFTPPPYSQLDDRSEALDSARLTDPAFARWVAHNVAPHKVPGYAAVTLSLKTIGKPPGDATDAQMDAVADWADYFGFGEIRVSHEQNLILPDVRKDDLPALYRAAVQHDLASTTVGTLADIICCPGGDFCSLANAKSIPIAEAIQRRFDDLDYLEDLGPIDLNISGCMNACGHHHVGHIGVLGVDKKGEEFYQVSIGGNQGNGSDASLGKILGPSVYADEVPDVVQRILEVYVALRGEDESFLDCLRRVGVEPFKHGVYANAA